jgi:eukaryotic-like serine/threonine-protein kinase
MGRTPYAGASLGSVFDEILHKSPPRLPHDPAAPPALDRVVTRCLQKDPNDRFQTAAEARDALDGCLLSGPHRTSSLAVAVRQAAKRPWAWIAATLIVATIAAAAVTHARHRAGVRWARERALPEIRRLASSGFDGWLPAFELAEEARDQLPDDSELKALLDSVSAETDVTSDPPAATVRVKPYAQPKAEWQLLGTTPLRRRLPADFLRWRIEKPGYATLDRVQLGAVWDRVRAKFVSGERQWHLYPAASMPPGMVRVEGAAGLPDFFVDRYEVTNREYRAFVAAGGYRDARHWKEPFVRDGRRLTFTEAMRLLVDRTGQPGPAGWETSVYPEGQDELPVTGVSWYEAAAYAAFAEKALPTVSHWGVATGENLLRVRDSFPRRLLPLSRFGGDGPLAVGTTEAMSPFGAVDQAGNVREWCATASEQGRCLRGGAWNDQTYMYTNVTQAPPFDRSLKNGFRCVKYVDAAAVPASAFEPYRVASVRDFAREKPVSDEVFAAYRELYSYDPRDVAAQVESRDESRPDWIHETVSISAAYGNERFRVHLFLPRTTPPPWQVVVYFPGTATQSRLSSDQLAERVEFRENLAFVPKSGRALVHPVYKGTYERAFGDGTEEVPPVGTRQSVSWHIQLVQDARRSLDYVATRSDLDPKRIGYYGFSWGGRMAGVVLAVEPRFRAAVLHTGGLTSRTTPLPEADLLNYITRVRVPTLLLAGRYDLAIPLETEARPMFDLLGTPAADKKLFVVDTDHWIPRPDLIRESVAWFDRYLGPVSAPAAAEKR